MKSGLVWMLALSLGANAALLAARWRSSPTPSSPFARDDAASVGPAAAGARALGEGPASGVAGAPSAPASETTLWSALDLGDLRSVAAALRAAGIPEDDVRVIVGAVIDDRYKARFEAIEARERQRPFWSVRGRGAGSEWASRYSESYGLWREAEALKRDVLGPEPLGLMEARNLRAQYGPLSEDRLQAMVQLERDYQDLSMQTGSFSSGPRMPWENEQAEFIAAERRRDIEALLTPEELATYDLHASYTSQDLRRQLAAFAPTEQEFLALYALQNEHVRTHGLKTPPMNEVDLSAAEKVKPQLIEQIKVTLGEERFREYERATDAGYRVAFSVTQRLNLPRENAATAYSLAEDTRAAVKALNRDTALTAVDRAAAMGRLLDEADARLDTILTPAGASVYRARSSQWRYVQSELSQKQREAR
ncbi:MAG: hypothetical protein IAE82_11430 [Opitutaceae bacterium]|nr:hypothetical protein [Opitutaceae bacterium]